MHSVFYPAFLQMYREEVVVVVLHGLQWDGWRDAEMLISPLTVSIVEGPAALMDDGGSSLGDSWCIADPLSKGSVCLDCSVLCTCVWDHFTEIFTAISP